MSDIENNSASLLIEHLQSWSVIFGRKLTQEASDAWLRLFVNEPSRVIKLALEDVTRTAERMPAPGHLTKAVRAAKEKLGYGWGQSIAAYTFEQAITQDPETGENVPVLVDPKDGTFLFQAKHCPEGREYLNKLHEISKNTVIPFPKPLSKEALELERQRQKLAYDEYLKNKYPETPGAA